MHAHLRPSMATIIWGLLAANALVIVLSSARGAAPLYAPEHRVVLLLAGWLAIWQIQRWYTATGHGNREVVGALCLAHIFIGCFAAINTAVFFTYAISVY